ncbi:helix-turn-helix transcriptional regulator [Photobacterium leiognathi]|uniref:helix-turn-helix transcriptional regulator n=1 Tax=Photobacterium leiognathi TaxID=553611 RepID=UPI0029811F81|nr:AlpA family phage regulatory protein [Photobacterium leiognathi]
MCTLQKSIIIRLPAVLNTMGISRATLYKQIQAGRFPRPVNLGARSVGWVSDEVQSVLNARVQGFDNNSLEVLVCSMHEARQERHS